MADFQKGAGSSCSVSSEVSDVSQAAVMQWHIFYNTVKSILWSFYWESCCRLFWGRVPVKAVVASRRHVWHSWGFHVGSDTMCLCTWIDNLFSASDCLGGAIAILEDFENELQRHWQLKIKLSSRSCMAARGNSEVPADKAKW